MLMAPYFCPSQALRVQETVTDSAPLIDPRASPMPGRGARSAGRDAPPVTWRALALVILGIVALSVFVAVLCLTGKCSHLQML